MSDKWEGLEPDYEQPTGAPLEYEGGASPMVEIDPWEGASEVLVAPAREGMNIPPQDVAAAPAIPGARGEPQRPTPQQVRQIAPASEGPTQADVEARYRRQNRPIWAKGLEGFAEGATEAVRAVVPEESGIVGNLEAQQADATGIVEGVAPGMVAKLASRLAAEEGMDEKQALEVARAGVEDLRRRRGADVASGQAGGMASLMAVPMARGLSPMQRMGAMALEGGAFGQAAGYGASEPGEELEGSLGGMATGAVAAPLVGVGMEKTLPVLGGMAARQAERLKNRAVRNRIGSTGGMLAGQRNADRRAGGAEQFVEDLRREGVFRGLPTTEKIGERAADAADRLGYRADEVIRRADVAAAPQPESVPGARMDIARREDFPDPREKIAAIHRQRFGEADTVAPGMGGPSGGRQLLQDVKGTAAQGRRPQPQEEEAINLARPLADLRDPTMMRNAGGPFRAAPPPPPPQRALTGDDVAEMFDRVADAAVAERITFKEDRDLAREIRQRGAEFAGKGPLSPTEIEMAKRKLYSHINWDAVPSGSPAKEALRQSAQAAREALEAGVERALGEGQGAAFRDLNRRRGAAIQVGEWAKELARREGANRSASPSDQAAGAVGYLSGGPLAGATAMAANRFFRGREKSIFATGQETLARILENNPQALGRYAAPLLDAARRGTAALASRDFVLSQRDPEYRQLMKRLQEQAQSEEQDQ